MELRRLGRIGREVSVLAYGAAALSDVTPEVAERSVQEALDGGITYLDVAASYGHAEERLGPLVPAIRNRVFLATKTGERDAESAWAEITRSLERLRTDHVDLIQLHAVGDPEDLDRATRTGGALDAAVRAQAEGLAGAIGITGHGHQAPATHLEALRRFPFATVITPWNPVLAARPDYRADFEALRAEVARQDAALLTIKTAARRNWPGAQPGQPVGERSHTTWYEPYDDDERLRAAVSWALAQPGVSALPTAADVSLLRTFLAAERDRLSVEEAERILTADDARSSPFEVMPW
ncbi:MAG: aldo/keto reductase [Candidatus Nanopelagicales bacterium]